jgi:hypothetical protein
MVDFDEAVDPTVVEDPVVDPYLELIDLAAGGSGGSVDPAFQSPTCSFH